MSVRHGVGISIIDRDNAAHISLTTPRTDFSFAGTPRWIFSRTSQASKGDRSPSFRWRLRICRGAPPRALRGLIFRTLGDGIDFFSSTASYAASNAVFQEKWRHLHLCPIECDFPSIDVWGDIKKADEMLAQPWSPGDLLTKGSMVLLQPHGGDRVFARTLSEVYMSVATLECVVDVEWGESSLRHEQMWRQKQRPSPWSTKKYVQRAFPFQYVMTILPLHFGNFKV